jgi:hypothetical protein
MLPSGTTDKLEERSWDMVGAMAMRGAWKKWRGRGTTRANRRNERMTRGDWGQADGRMI